MNAMMIRPCAILALALLGSGCGFEIPDKDGENLEATFETAAILSLPFRWRERKFAKNIYRQYYDAGTSGEFRVITYLWDGKKWISGIPRALANDVRRRGSLLDSGVSNTTNPNRNAAMPITERLYAMDDYNAERIAVFDPVAGTRIGNANLPHNRPVSIAGRLNVPLIYVAHQAELPGGFFAPHPPGISVFDKRTNQIVKHQALPSTLNPRCCEKGLALSPDGNRLYLVNTNGFNDPSSIEVYDTATLANVASIPSQTGTFQQIVTSLDGTMLFATRSDSRVVLIDTLTNTVSNVLFSASSTSPAFHPDGTKVYLARRTSIGVFDTATATVPTTIAVPGAVDMNQLEITSDGINLFAVDNQARKLFVIDTISNTVVQTLDSSPGSALFVSE